MFILIVIYLDFDLNYYYKEILRENLEEIEVLFQGQGEFFESVLDSRVLRGLFLKGKVCVGGQVFRFA